MHNLLLGTARHVFRLWTELGILTTKNLGELQARVENIKVPHDVGRIPLRISSGFTGFTADQWKNWTTIYFTILSEGIGRSRWIPAEISVKICQTVWPVALLPQHASTSPIYSFWCFSFERFNGILRKFNNNNRTVAVQIMRQFHQSQQLHMPWKCEYGAEIDSIFGRPMVGTLSCNDKADMFYVSDLVSAERLLLENCTVVPRSSFYQTILNEPDRHAMLTMSHQMYPIVSLMLTVLPLHANG